MKLAPTSASNSKAKRQGAPRPYLHDFLSSKRALPSLVSSAPSGFAGAGDFTAGVALIKKSIEDGRGGGVAGNVA